MTTIILITFGFFLMLGAAGSLILNKAKWLPRIGSYEILTRGQYVFKGTTDLSSYENDYGRWQNNYSNGPLLSSGFSYGGKKANQLSLSWWIKEVMIVFPLLGAYNFILTVYALLTGIFFSIFVSTEIFGVSLGLKANGYHCGKRLMLQPWSYSLYMFHVRYPLIF